MTEIESILSNCLDEHQGKVSEFQLLQFIEKSSSGFFDLLPDKTKLYQRHFWLFHSLYKLKLNWLKSNRHLKISALEISYTLNNGHQQKVTQHDPLTEFYLDEKNLHLSEQDIVEMQKKFWSRYLALNEKADAIKTLGLTGKIPLELKDVKRAFQKLASIHHPDKGGSAEKFSEVKKAYQDLILLFS